MAISSQGVSCAVFVNSAGNAFYQIVDSATGETLVPATAIVSAASSSATHMPRVFTVGNYFIITFLADTSQLQYIPIPINSPTTPLAPAIITTFATSLTVGYDGCLFGGNLYLAWGGGTTGSYAGVSAIMLSTTAGITLQFAEKLFTMAAPAVVSITSDASTNRMWVSASATTTVYSISMGSDNIPATSVQSVAAGGTVVALTSLAASGTDSIFCEISNTYPTISPPVRSDYIIKTTTTGTSMTSPTVFARSVGLASKAFLMNSIIYMLVAYNGSLQPSYFLMDQTGTVVSRLAYENGGGYIASQVLPNVLVTGDSVQIPYLYKELVRSAGVGTDDPTTAVTAQFYTQTGVNLATFTFNQIVTNTCEIAGSLHLTGGQLVQYDGQKPVEFSFQVFPEDILATWSTSGGSMHGQPRGVSDASQPSYFYQVCYEWTDGQGLLHRSAPSIAIAVNTSGSSSTSGSVSLQIPTLRLTQKKVSIVIYRWSTQNQVFYQVNGYSTPGTSGNTLLLNDTSVDYVTYQDTQADASILGKTILYTTGGVVEDIAAPASTAAALFKTRLFLIDAEDQNLLWYSKQVIESTPVEMSDLFTIYVAPTISAQGPTGPMKVISAMDDKLIIFKKNAIYYITGTGPDNTGANNDFSDPVYISSTVGCANTQSIVLTPNGLMFQSDKGIWLLGRDLSTSYIGAPVEIFNSATVVSALTIPGTNQVRFTMDNGRTLMYDYFYGQWGTFTGIPGVSSVLYQDMHTFLNLHHQVQQETPGVYMDAAQPVLMSFTTGWFNLAGLQGYQRAYYFQILGKDFTPHKLLVNIGVNYEPGFSQNAEIVPTNVTDNYGSDPLYGSEESFGGGTNVEQQRIFLQKQRGMAFQLQVQEVFDPSLGFPAGAGLTLSGVNFVVAAKNGYRPIPNVNSTGAQ
jgi:hypothetical protein